jgi:DNA-binding response OmpR family regulator
MAKKNKILLVEDNPIHREVIYDGLEDFDFEIEKAEDIESARKILEDFAPDLFILDIVFGSIKNQGILFQDELRKNPKYKDIPTLFISAHLDESEIAEHFPEDSRENVLPKPFGFDKLLNKIREILRD